METKQSLARSLNTSTADNLPEPPPDPTPDLIPDPVPSQFIESPAAPSAESVEPSAVAPTQEGRAADFVTLDLALHDARSVLEQQQQLRQFSLTQLNILFVVNTALLTLLSISRLIFNGGLLSFAEIAGFLISFSLLIYALLPRRVFITPNLDDRESIERYLALAPDDYRLQMLTNLIEVYNANKQRLDDIIQALQLAGYAVWTTVVLTLLHIFMAVLMTAPPPMQ
jgi:hypothetical protein